LRSKIFSVLYSRNSGKPAKGAGYSEARGIAGFGRVAGTLIMVVRENNKISKNDLLFTVFQFIDHDNDLGFVGK